MLLSPQNRLSMQGLGEDPGLIIEKKPVKTQGPLNPQSPKGCSLDLQGMLF